MDDNARQFVKDLGISTPSVRQQVKNLSGGNQQKVAVGKWLAADCDVYISVSYTHLDVYKRQGLSCGEELTESERDNP